MFSRFLCVFVFRDLALNTTHILACFPASTKGKMVFNLEEVIVAPIDPKTLEILRLFDFSKNTTENIAALVEKFDREKLQEAVSYIKANYKDTHPIIIQKIAKRKSRTTQQQRTPKIII